MRTSTMKRRKSFWPVFLSLLPVIIILAVLRVYPIAVAVAKSFTNWDGLFRSDWVGLANYANFVKGGPFWMVLRNTMILLINVPLQVFIGLVVALLLYEKVKGWRFYRAMIYVPQIISAVIIGFLFKIFFGFNGPFNMILRGIGLSGLAIEWFRPRCSRRPSSTGPATGSEPSGSSCPCWCGCWSSRSSPPGSGP
jgi:multiple sugar transport system permease protein